MPQPDLHRFRMRATGIRGFTLIEVLVTIVIMLLGILGVIGMQARSALVEFESYQRGEALALVRDIQSRLTDSRGIVSGFLDSSVSSTDGSVYVGSGRDFSVSSLCVPGAGVALAEAKFEMCQWAQALQGAAAQEGTAKVGAMIGAVGCLIQVNPPQGDALADFYVTIVWQGKSKGAEPPTGSPADLCAKNSVNFGTGLRRGVSVRVLVPNLTKSS